MLTKNDPPIVFEPIGDESIIKPPIVTDNIKAQNLNKMPIMAHTITCLFLV